MSWEIFGEASRVLAQMVADDYEPDMILSIARGGLLIGGALGYALSVKNVYTMNVEFYTGVDERLEVPRVSVRSRPDGAPFASDQGNLILDCDFGPILRPTELAAEVGARAGIIEHGLFLGLATDLIVAGDAGITHRTRS